MKLRFEDNLDYQQDAISAVVDLFKGQNFGNSEFTVCRPTKEPGLFERERGTGNRRFLTDDDMLTNLREVQKRNGLKPADQLDFNFTVEMETGTGKTYVYLRTILELNKHYGFTKFIIVVPSVAIKEGVYKTLQITKDHFEALYPKAKGYNYFLYDSAKLAQLREFALNPGIQIMVMTVGAINKKEMNNIYKSGLEAVETLGYDKAIDLITAVKPILIVDEPQSVDGGKKGKGKSALDDMNPLCALRYSATHAEKFSPVYKLDAVDAYNKGLVKKICISSAHIFDGYNSPYIKLIKVKKQRGSVVAEAELHVQTGKEVKTKILTLSEGDNLAERTGRDIYKNMSIGVISLLNDRETAELRIPGEVITLSAGESFGGIDHAELKRKLIHQTIRVHLEREKEFKAKKLQIKVLSLFFIDKVENYRRYSENGGHDKGIYAKIFEEEYTKLARLPEFQELFERVDLTINAEEVHNGYFAADKKGVWTNTEDTEGKGEKNQSERDNAQRAYELIMRDKEKLLSFDTKLKFIFSHSALKEGWDNPNVFQICTLRDLGTERNRRQTLGRGLRLCVDQTGEREKDPTINILTVVAEESFSAYAEALQTEIAESGGYKFGYVEAENLSLVTRETETGEQEILSHEKAEKLIERFKQQGLLEPDGKATEALKIALDNNELPIPEDLQDFTAGITEALTKLVKGIVIKDEKTKQIINPRRAILDGAEFKELWDKIKQKTKYSVEFNADRLIENCASRIRKSPPVPVLKIRFEDTDMDLDRGGISGGAERIRAFHEIKGQEYDLPDILTKLEEGTGLKRRSLCTILEKSERLEDFSLNPEQFIKNCLNAINQEKRATLTEGVRYEKLSDDNCYEQSLFNVSELTTYLKETLAAKKSVYEAIPYDSAVERNFASELEKQDNVKVYAKLPNWFVVPTPLGKYNPDWAILIEKNGSDRLYFIVETKGSVEQEDLRGLESGKIECGKKHFAVIGSSQSNPPQFHVIKKLDDLLSGL